MRKKLNMTAGIFPMPVLLIATYNEDGTVNVMNAAWGTMQERDTVVLNLSEGHKTVENLKARGAFTVSIADAAHLVEADYVGLVSGNTTPDKIAKAGLHPLKSEFVDAPLIDELPVAMECELLKITEDGNIIGRIVNVSADESVLDADGSIDLGKFRPISFEPVHRVYHVMGERVGNAFSDGAALNK